jgi:hypothetical protein
MTDGDETTTFTDGDDAEWAAEQREMVKGYLYAF